MGASRDAWTPAGAGVSSGIGIQVDRISPAGPFTVQGVTPGSAAAGRGDRVEQMSRAEALRAIEQQSERLNRVQPGDLADQPFIATGLDEPQELANFRQRYGLGKRVGGYAENLHETKRLIELGVGVGFLPTCVAETLDHEGALWPLLPEAVLPAYQVYLVTRDEPARNTPTELFLAEIMGKLREAARGT